MSNWQRPHSHQKPPTPGVVFDRVTGKWYPRIQYKGVRYSLGSYLDTDTDTAIRKEAEAIKDEESIANPLDVTVFHRRIEAPKVRYSQNEQFPGTDTGTACAVATGAHPENERGPRRPP